MVPVPMRNQSMPACAPLSTCWASHSHCARASIETVHTTEIVHVPVRTHLFLAQDVFLGPVVAHVDHDELHPHSVLLVVLGHGMGPSLELDCSAATSFTLHVKCTQVKRSERQTSCVGIGHVDALSLRLAAPPNLTGECLCPVDIPGNLRNQSLDSSFFGLSAPLLFLP